MRAFVLLFLLVPLTGATGCGEDIQCLLDTDCEAGLICTNQVCGPTGAFDMGPADAAVVDAVSDVPTADDMGAADSGSDEGVGPDAALSDAASCMVNGEYELTRSAGDAVECPDISCTVSTTDLLVTLTCGAIAPTCTLDDACVCTGSGPLVLDGEDVDLSVDFANLTTTVTTRDTEGCTYTMVRP